MTPSSPAPRRHLALVGMMGTGKSTIGRRAARTLSRPFVDLDQTIEIAAGNSVPDIFARDGEACFRELEATVLRDELARPDPMVIATGGGAVLASQNRAALAERATVVWLRARQETLQKRLRDGRGRPLLEGDDVGARIEQLLAERSELYREVADVIVDVDGLSHAQVADAVVDAGCQVAR